MANHNERVDASTDESNPTTTYGTTDGITVTIEAVVEPSGETVRKEFSIGSFTDLRSGGDLYWCFIDEDGQGRFMLTTDEFRELVGGAQGGER